MTVFGNDHDTEVYCYARILTYLPIYPKIN